MENLLLGHSWDCKMLDRYLWWDYVQLALIFSFPTGWGRWRTRSARKWRGTCTAIFVAHALMYHTIISSGIDRIFGIILPLNMGTMKLDMVLHMLWLIILRNSLETTARFHRFRMSYPQLQVAAFSPVIFFCLVVVNCSMKLNCKAFNNLTVRSFYLFAGWRGSSFGSRGERGITWKQNKSELMIVFYP